MKTKGLSKKQIAIRLKELIRNRYHRYSGEGVSLNNALVGDLEGFDLWVIKDLAEFIMELDNELL